MRFSDRLILALDFSSRKEALYWVEQSLPYVKTYKVGKQLFTQEGPRILRDIQERGGRVFLDLKFHDIPNTVAEVSRVVMHFGVFMFNVHAMGGMEMLKAARQARDEAVLHNKQKPLLVAVTVLTSLSTDQLRALGFIADVNELVLKYAHLAKTAGLDGVVCSVEEVSKIKESFGLDFITVTPAIRMERRVIEKEDQKRISSLTQALESQSDFLILGRSFFQEVDPISLLKITIEKLSDE